MVFSAGSSEGRASRAQEKCNCASCAATQQRVWYRSLLGALEDLPGDIIRCAKVTPHDFHPALPHNPAIVPRKRPMWVE